MAFESIGYSTDRVSKDWRNEVRNSKGQFVSADPTLAPRKLIEGALKRAALRSPQSLDNACNKLLDSAAYGETWQERIAAFREIADRLDGKAVARIETSDGDTRNMGLADLVQLVLNARKADAIDAQTHSQAEQAPGAEHTQPAE